jgi:protein SCO1/2
MKINGLYFLGFAVFLACTPPKSTSERLPFFGEPTILTRVENGESFYDTIWPVLPPFSMLNQAGDTVTEAVGLGKVQIADFFFTTCPTICPVMTKQLARVHEAYRQQSKVIIFSYTIDPKHDSMEVLWDYAQRVDAQLPGWQFLRGNMDETFALADAHGSFAREDIASPGGFEHSGVLVLIDGKRRVRGLYNGVDGKEVDQLIGDIERLLVEHE